MAKIMAMFEAMKVASFAYDAWIEIDCMVRWSGFIESHRLRTMRGLKCPL